MLSMDRHLLLLFVSRPFSSLGAVDGFGLRTVDEVQQLVNVSVVDDPGRRQLRVLALRQLFFTPGQARPEFLADLSVVAACRRSWRLRSMEMLSFNTLLSFK